jgi:hypothetical protein
MPQIKINFTKNGTSRVVTEGFSGEGCLQASKFVEDALGTASEEKKTSEFYEQSEGTVHLNIDEKSS